MSSANYSSAWRTKLGNHPAKDVLMKLVDEANVDGLGWASQQLVAEHTELSLRTVRRVIQVFEAMGLLRRCKARNQYGRIVNAFQLSVKMLGRDLRPEFDRRYRLAQGSISERAATEKTSAYSESVLQTSAQAGSLRAEIVSETGQAASQTPETVLQTESPNPFNRVPVSDPLLTPPPVIPLSGGMCDELEPFDFDSEERAHLERCPGEERAGWEEFYRSQKVERAAAEKRRSAAQTDFPTRAAAIERIMRNCSFQRGLRRNDLPEILGQVLDAEMTRGEPVWVTAPLLVFAWEAQRMRKDPRVVKYGAVKFFRDGQWKAYIESN